MTSAALRAPPGRNVTSASSNPTSSTLRKALRGNPASALLAGSPTDGDAGDDAAAAAASAVHAESDGSTEHCWLSGPATEEAEVLPEVEGCGAPLLGTCEIPPCVPRCGSQSMSTKGKMASLAMEEEGGWRRGGREGWAGLGKWGLRSLAGTGVEWHPIASVAIQADKLFFH